MRGRRRDLDSSTPYGRDCMVAGAEDPKGGRVADRDITFLFDFVDPGSYVVFELLRRQHVGEGPGRIRMRPLELVRPKDRMISPDDRGWREMSEHVGRIAGQKGIPFRLPSRVPRTRKAHELALHGLEKEVPLHGALFRAHFESGLDLGRIDTLVTVAEDAGLDGAEVRTVLGVDRFEPMVRASRDDARRLRVRGVPTLIVPGSRPEEGEIRLEGLRSAEELEEFLDRASHGTDGLRT
jgi:predicted DsbA family dithiol-disulfide isomerase